MNACPGLNVNTQSRNDTWSRLSSQCPAGDEDSGGGGGDDGKVQ